MMSTTPLKQLDNLRWYIKHLIHESGYLYDDDESNYPPSEDKWMLQSHGKFMKYVLFTFHRMTPEQLKMNPFKSIIILKTNEELDKEERESIKDEEESTETCQELSEEQNATSDIYAQDKEESKSIETSQVHNVLNKSIQNEVDSDTVKHVTEIELPILMLTTMQRCQIINKLISVNYWFGCDWCFCEVRYLSRHARQLSLICALVYLWNTSYIWVMCLGMEIGIQYTPAAQIEDS